MKYFNQVKAIIAGLMLGASVVPAVLADDIEIYTTLPADQTVSNPNIMFVVDTSASMEATKRVKPSYDPSVTYPVADGMVGCVSDGIYLHEKDSIEEYPDCSAGNYFNASALVCDHAVAGYNADGTKVTPAQDGSLLMVGTYSDQMAHYDTTANRWVELDDMTSDAKRNYIVECLSDSGIHGATTGGNQKYIRDGGTGYTATAPANLAVPHPVWAGGAGNVQLFAGNYINYLNWSPANLIDPALALVPADPLSAVDKSYIDQVKDAVEVMVRGNTRVDIGLMRFDRMSANGTSGNSEGGPVLYPIRDVGADRTDFFTRLNTLDSDGYSPLSETYYEALLYYGGRATDYSDASTPSNQVVNLTEKPNGEFRSPISSTCDRNYIVLLSAGSPTLDVVNETRQSVLPDFTGSCSTDVETVSIPGNGGSTRDGYNAVDNCLPELSGWAATKDVATDPNIPAHEGDQHIFTHTIGLDLDPATDADAIALLNTTAVNGNGQFYQASDEGKLVSIFNDIIANILAVNSTFSSPAVSVNAFNRSTHLDDLYFTLFKPEVGNHWEGNLKKYKLKFAVDTTDKNGNGDTTERLPYIADQLNAPAIDDTTGFFSDFSKSYWTPGNIVDGKEVSKGGAVSVLTTGRNVFTFTGTYTGADTGLNVPNQPNALANDVNRVRTSNDSLTDAMLSTPSGAEIVAGTSNRDTLINWAAGLDALSQYGDLNSYDDVRPQMGDPLHAEPALVQYGETTFNGETVADLVAYVATNDGYLHAFNVNTGAELFSFIPQELLSQLPRVMLNRGGSKSYGLDGSVVAWIDDADGNGTIGVGEKVYLYVSMRRGGNNIYALDVTDRTAPVLKWVIKGGNGAYQELGQTWSTVNVEKVKDGTTAKTVLIFGGGYDPAQDGATVRTADSKGRAIFIVDAETGERLWSGGENGDTSVDNMDYSIPARVKPLDISGDGFIDRLYAVDMGGQVFRFDINNTNDTALVSSITGGRILDIGDSADTDARRFYYPPDVALIDAPDGKYHGLVLSSGFRAHPLNEVIHDRIYMIKDRNIGLTSTYTTLTEDDLQNVTANTAGGEAADDAARNAELANIAGAEGWYIDLEDEANPGSWIGEKGLAEPLILEGTAIVTTYTPNVTVAANSCEPNLGLGKVYFLDMLDGTAAFPSDLDSRSDRHIELLRGGIPPSPNVIITKGGEPTLCVGTECQPADFGLGVRKTYWYEVEK